VATPPVELATRTKILQLDGLASTAAPAAISSPGFLGAIVAQEGRPTIPKVGREWIEAFSERPLDLPGARMYKGREVAPEI
jgi:hypothetical protein